jgi:type I restriction enzyme S subunit
MFYRETELQDSSLGKIPREWDVRELGDKTLTDIVAGQSPPSSTYNKKRLGLPFLQGKMEFGEMFPSPTTYCSEPIKVAEKNDILLSVRAPVGDVNIAPFECCIGRGLAAIRAKADKLDHLFLFYYLRREGRRFEALSTGSTFKAIRIHEIEKFSIPVPSVEEQRTVVGVLGIVDLAVAKTGEVIAKTERLKKGLMQELLTRGIGHKEHKQTPIGKVPASWDVVKIEDVAETSSGGTPNRSKKEYYDGSIPWAKSGELKDNTIYDTEEKITENGLKNSSAKLFPHGTLLVAMYGATVGKTGILGIDATTNQAICAILPKNNTLNLTFLQYYIIFARSHWISQSSGGAQPNISQEIIRTSRIPLPQFEEQQKIAEILSTLDKKLALERNEKARLERTKQGLMDLLLTGKVRVKED